MEVINGNASLVQRRLEAYFEEKEAIERKLEREISDGKAEKLIFRLDDIKERLIPQLTKNLYA